MTKELSGGRLNDAAYAVKSVLFSLLGTVILLFVCAAAATYLTASESAVSLTVAAVTAVCIMWGGFRYARHLGRQGLISGALSGLLYVILLYIIGVLVFCKFSFGVSTVLTMIVGVGCGAIGGIIGVNTGTKRRR